MTPENLRVVLDWLDGKKTYLIAACAVLYVVGGDAGWWPVNDSVLTILGFGGLASLRKGIKSQP